jgi:hypothetical protein
LGMATYTGDSAVLLQTAWALQEEWSLYMQTLNIPSLYKGTVSTGDIRFAEQSIISLAIINWLVLLKQTQPSEVPKFKRRSRWPRGLRDGSETTHLVELRVWIPPMPRIFLSGECCDLSVRRTDPSPRGVLPSVMHLRVISIPWQWGSPRLLGDVQPCKYLKFKH